MIDTFSIISYGGAVLWQKSSHETKRSTFLNRMIQEVILEDRVGRKEYLVNDLKAKWALENSSQFYAVAIFPKFISSNYIEDFLQDAVSIFKTKFESFITQRCTFSTTFDFSEEYDVLLSKLEASDAANGNEIIDTFNNSAQSVLHGSDIKHPSLSLMNANALVPEGELLDEVVKQGPSTLPSKRGRRGGKKGSIATNTSATGVAPKEDSKDQSSKKKPSKLPTTWDSDPNASRMNRVSKQDMKEEELEAMANFQRDSYIKRLPNGSVAPVNEKEWTGQKRGKLATWLRAYVGSRELDGQDFSSVIPHLREKLITKNVAVEVAEHVCDSVEKSLAGVKLGTFDSLHKAVEKALVSSLQRILQPKHEVNILRDVTSAKARRKPYVIVFCGVNGVGKSTSLAKIAYWLKQNQFSVLIAAGDTFRRGAVEQLEVHGRCLELPIFQMGYGADPSALAASAISQAARQAQDVVLIDTAGRMEDHDSRMRALAKLIHDNQPDLVLFVGEALVGNNGVEQLRKFNQCLIDYAPIGHSSRGIDGIVLTKFDTIDDKVGAALSMVYELGQPIVFVGVGQTYQDLKIIEPGVVVSALMQ